MVILSPTTDAQEFDILPRDPDSLVGLNLVITEEDSKTQQLITGLDAWRTGDKVTISAAFTILHPERLYKISITDSDANNWWRGKARCTEKTDYTEKHSIMDVDLNDFLTLTDDETFTTLDA